MKQLNKNNYSKLTKQLEKNRIPMVDVFYWAVTSEDAEHMT